MFCQMTLEDASEYSINNAAQIKQAQIAGCYYCKSIYSAVQISEYVDDGLTALCPKCGIDSVLPDTAPFDLTVETLARLKRIWF